MSKVKNLTEVILKDWEGTKANHSFFKTLSNEAYTGYITASILRDYHGKWSSQEIFEKVQELIFNL